MRLNLNDLIYIINESKNILLTENTSVSAAYRKYFSDMDKNIYDRLVNLDPTYDENKPDVMGKYGVWILNQYKKGNINNDNNLTYIKYYLSVFTKFINRIENKNLQSYKNPEELQKVVQPFIDNPYQSVSNRQKKIKVREDAENVYEDKDWVVIVPKSWEASKVYGAHTKWCTTEKKNSHYYDYYSSKAPLYIVISKKDKDNKYQIHMPEDGEWQFKDSKDIEVEKPIYNLHFTDGLVGFFNGISDKFEKTYFRILKNEIGDGYYFIKSSKGNFIEKNGNKIKVDYDFIDYFYDGVAIVKKDGKCNFMNKEGKIISDTWFDMVHYFNNGFAEVKKDNEHNFIDENGKLISDMWFDLTDDFDDYGFAEVKKNDKWNLIDRNGKLIYGDYEDIDGWFNSIDEFHNGLARVGKNQKYNFINTEGKLSFDIWFDRAYDFDRNGFSKVKKDYKWNFIDKNGKLIYGNLDDTSTWFDEASCFYDDGTAIVLKNNKYNFINIEGELIYGNPDDISTWFDDVEPFNNGFTNVKKDGEWIRINKKGDIINKK